MKIELELGYYEAIALRRQLHHGQQILAPSIADEICEVLTSAIENFEERRRSYAQNVNAGLDDESMERQNSTSAGKGLR